MVGHESGSQFNFFSNQIKTERILLIIASEYDLGFSTGRIHGGIK
jgi:hypothetical protein